MSKDNIIISISLSLAIILSGTSLYLANVQVHKEKANAMECPKINIGAQEFNSYQSMYDIKGKKTCIYDIEESALLEGFKTKYLKRRNPTR